MKELNMQKGIDQVKKVSLTSEEKSRMLHNLSLYTTVHQPIPATHSLFAFFNISLNKRLAFALASVMIAIIIGGSAVYASEGALPGDLLYPIKTKIVEPVRVALATTPVEKANVEADIGIERLKEAETLDQKGRLTPDIKNELDHKVKDNFTNFFKIKKQVAGTSSEEINKKIQSELDNRIKPHINMFNKLNDNFKNSTSTEKNTDIKNNWKNTNSTGTIKNIKKMDYKNASSGENTKKIPFQSNF
jgi:hypothetical protein